MVIYASEGSHYLKPVIAGREEELSQPMRRRMAWPPPDFSDYLDALQKVEMLRQATADLFTEYDLLLCPTSPIPANPHDPISLETGVMDHSAVHDTRGRAGCSGSERAPGDDPSRLHGLSGHLGPVWLVQRRTSHRCPAHRTSPGRCAGTPSGVRADGAGNLSRSTSTGLTRQSGT